MKSTELRIGNIIKIKNPILKDLIDEGFQKIYTDRTTVIYVGYDYLGVIIDNSEVEIMLQDIEPIPLTEEWLLKFGFIKDEDLGDMVYYQMPEKKRGYGVCFDHDEIVLYHYNILGITNLIYGSKHFQNVHQLQNIYFALTGEELTINK